MQVSVKKNVEEVKEVKEPLYVEVELKLDHENRTVESFHTVCTRLGNVTFVEGKASVTKEVAEELKKLEVVK